ncbi:uncharacterized protein CCR75_001862 [Bremia lactucae]|uniref:Bromo domain-containing protein n=1 Tax=Bremia lactucae TaxID=4779 RepID=A0A976FPG0_BRELC|nr:hypothetical protein CCR75_001862 [Bremia lactucae]
MAIADIMSAGMSAKYMDSSSSSSLSSDSENLSSSSSSLAISSSSSNSEADSDPPRASVKKIKRSQGQMRLDDKGATDMNERRKKMSKKKARLAVSHRPSNNAKVVEKKTLVAVPPSLLPLRLPPPPPPALSTFSSSCNSFSDSSSSSSSLMSDTEKSFTPPPPPPPPADKIDYKAAGVGATEAKPPKQKVTSADGASSSLKVTLKLPPGFVANNDCAVGSRPTADISQSLHLQAEDSNATTENGPRIAINLSRLSKPVTNSRSAKKSMFETRGPCAHASGSAASAPQMNGSRFPGLSKPISADFTLLAGEIRGAKELSFVDPAIAGNHPDETIEANISQHFNDSFAHDGEILRLLDMFYFCDENGKAISLEILDCPKEQRLKIMGFGTVVEHLPLAERPLPIKPILASPAFPSRSKKRPRADSSSFTPAKSSSKARARPKVAGSGKKCNKRSKAVDEDIYQGDGELEDEEDATLHLAGPDIFERSCVYQTLLSPFQRHMSQVDGQLNSDGEGSDFISDDKAVNSGKKGSGVDSGNSEILSSASSSSTENDSANDIDSCRSFSSRGSDAESGGTVAPTSPAAIRNDYLSQQSTDFPRIVTGKERRRPSIRVDSRNVGLPSAVVELMRTDQAVEVNEEGSLDELNLLECGFRHPSHYARARVWLPEITDWCLDYADGDPTLWVITPHAWYKIAGPLSGLLPHPSYRQTFKHVRYLFEASYLVAYVLKAWLPINKKVSYRATLQQIIELSLLGRYRVSAWFLVKNYPFIKSQIINLFPDKEYYLESMFFKQLHRLHENYTLREKRHQKEMAQREARRAKRENERLEKKQRVENERQRLKDEREEERKQKEEEQKYPVDDLQLLERDAINSNIFPLDCSTLKGVQGPLLGELVMAWQTICTFKDFVGLESISLEALAECITARCDKGTHIGLTRIFLAFLRVILSEKSFMSQLDDLVVEGNIKVSDLFLNSERTYGICERAHSDMLNAVTWQEILRQLMSKDLGIDTSIGQVDSLVGCEIVRQTLYMQNNSAPFNFPVDTSSKGLEDYTQLVKNPMDLGTIKQKIVLGDYEVPGGWELFAKDVRLVWDNALLYNGEDSEVGRAALALSDVFEQDYDRFVVGRIRANESRIEACRKVKETLQNLSVYDVQSFQYSDVVYGLYCSEFFELPTAYKIGALSWICSEFLTLSSIRTYMASQVDQEMLILKNYRMLAADLDSRRKHSDRMRRERDNAFRMDCANQGIHPNSHNVFSEGIKRRHEFIAKFFEDLQAEKMEDEKRLEQEKKKQAQEMASKLKSLVIRVSPLGKDRFHNSYYMFKHDAKPRLFIERRDCGNVIICSTKAHIVAILEWLNPKGIRELDLLTKLNAVKDVLLSGSEDEESQASDTLAGIAWTNKANIELQTFPLPGGAIASEIMTITDADRVIESHSIARDMLLCLKKHLENTNTLSASWEGAQTWNTRVQEATLFKEQLDLFAELENAAVSTSKLGMETIRPSWRRKRHEWRLALKGSCTYAQLVFLLHLLLEELINVEAFMDLHICLDRQEWLKLRPKETHNFIPEVGKTVLYFGNGHAAALKEDEKSKRRRFTQKSDLPARNATLICTVKKISYHHGGGDPYALAVLKPISNMAQHECIRESGTLFCPLPSREQRLARVFLRILAKLKMLTDAGPFLEPVSDREFPQYKEIVLHPMDLGTITAKASNLVYKNSVEFMADLRLMRDNCQLFCEGRFPTLPPLAHNLLYVADGHMKKWSREIHACEDASSESSSIDTDKFSLDTESGFKLDESDHEASISSELPTRIIETVLRLENRLPEYVVDISRYSWAVNRRWRCGENFRMLFRNAQGQPGDYYNGVTAGSLPFNCHGLLPWESLRITWDEDDGSDDNCINPWEAEFSPKI